VPAHPLCCAKSLSRPSRLPQSRPCPFRPHHRSSHAPPARRARHGPAALYHHPCRCGSRPATARAQRPCVCKSSSFSSTPCAVTAALPRLQRCFSVFASAAAE
jgi:hypothetical protein